MRRSRKRNHEPRITKTSVVSLFGFILSGLWMFVGEFWGWRNFLSVWKLTVREIFILSGSELPAHLKALRNLNFLIFNKFLLGIERQPLKSHRSRFLKFSVHQKYLRTISHVYIPFHHSNIHLSLFFSISCPRLLSSRCRSRIFSTFSGPVAPDPKAQRGSYKRELSNRNEPFCFAINIHLARLNTTRPSTHGDVYIGSCWRRRESDLHLCQDQGEQTFK